MGWIYNGEELKTKEDFILQFHEINAYAALDGMDFDFGTGMIQNEMSFGSEDAYYEMDLQNLEEIIEWWDYDFAPKRMRKVDEKPKQKEITRYERKWKARKKRQTKRLKIKPKKEPLKRKYIRAKNRQTDGFFI